MKNDPILAALDRLDQIPLQTPEGKAELTKALAAKSNLIVAKAARLLGSAQWTELAPLMIGAFDRMMAKGSAADKGCAAMIAIARALVTMEHDAPELYLRGMRYIQMEASYGPAIDTAAELREVCVMGLANSVWPHKLRDMILLLADSEWKVRAGAIRAIAVVGGEPAALLLRFKIITGDQEPEVMAECFTAAIDLEGAEGVKIVARATSAAKPELREAAILALGASRRPDAIEWLKEKLQSTADREGRRAILLALATSRVEGAIEFLLELVRSASDFAAAQAQEALGIHARDEQLRARLEEAIRSRTR
ncbi:MAG TPA: HEAT repeat domain-containing protein [Bryobacteraceae bacterium]|nr:HEAT repeat domain-containing protein [Bryobacteraceae bacterium]